MRQLSADETEETGDCPFLHSQSMLLLLLHCHLFCHLSCHLSCHLFCDMIAPHCGSRQGQYSTGRVHCSALLHYEATLESVRSATHTTHTQHTYTAHSIKHIALSARPPHTSTLRYSALLCSDISHILPINTLHYTALPCWDAVYSHLYFTLFHSLTDAKKYSLLLFPTTGISPEQRDACRHRQPIEEEVCYVLGFPCTCSYFRSDGGTSADI